VVNTEKLRTMLRDQNVSIEQAADAIGIDRATLYRRFQQSDNFTVAEVDLLAKLLQMSEQDMRDIFFDG